MTEHKRQALLVGSMPFEDEEDAMTRALDTLGADLWALPDGESDAISIRMFSIS